MQTDDACGDLPYVTMVKNLVEVVPNANGTYTVNYAIVVNNVGGATGSYSLKDTPQFDNDVTINSGSYGGQANWIHEHKRQQHWQPNATIANWSNSYIQCKFQRDIESGTWFSRWRRQCIHSVWVVGQRTGQSSQAGL